MDIGVKTSPGRAALWLYRDPVGNAWRADLLAAVTEGIY